MNQKQMKLNAIEPRFNELIGTHKFIRKPNVNFCKEYGIKISYFTNCLNCKNLSLSYL